MRRDSRVTALCLIFERYFNENPFDEDFISEQKEKDKEFTEQLLTCYKENKDEIEGLIEDALIGYEKDRVYKIDFAIMSLALVEIMYLSTPKQVAINEACEIAKKYSTENSSKFINGILAKIVNGEEKC